MSDMRVYIFLDRVQNQGNVSSRDFQDGSFSAFLVPVCVMCLIFLIFHLILSLAHPSAPRCWQTGGIATVSEVTVPPNRGRTRLGWGVAPRSSRMSRRRSTGDLVPRDISEILAREARAQRGQKKSGGSLGQAFGWIKGNRKKKSISNGSGYMDAKVGFRNHDHAKGGWVNILLESGLQNVFILGHCCWWHCWLLEMHKKSVFLSNFGFSEHQLGTMFIEMFCHILCAILNVFMFRNNWADCEINKAHPRKRIVRWFPIWLLWFASVKHFKVTEVKVEPFLYTSIMNFFKARVHRCGSFGHENVFISTHRLA